MTSNGESTHEASSTWTGQTPEIVIIHLETFRGDNKIPTTFIPLAPDALRITQDGLDVLSGVFHIMWRDMPQPRTYRLRLSNLISFDGEYAGCWLECDGSHKIAC
ncbi:MAG TPA: hypothetical protein VFF30_02340 [Nitrososphaerales archaeon]|nr:hypothetical protein [Nitrososphaerales archaeon]